MEYSILAEDYDALNPKEEIFKQRGFFIQILNKYKIKTCLDCACGTGWHLILLNELGLECYGSDLSPEMLARARTNAKGKDISLKQGDYRCLSNVWNRTFDLVICMSNSIRHMLTPAETVAAFNSMYDVLSEDGVLVVHNGFSDALIDSKPKVIPGRIHEDQAFYFVLEYPNTQEIVFNILNVKKIQDSFIHRFESMPLNAMRKLDFEKCFLQTRFRKIDFYGGFELFPHTSKNCGRLVIVAHKVAEPCLDKSGGDFYES